MENLELKSLGVQELDTKEMKEIDGGTEIGYWLGYHATGMVKAIGRYILEAGSYNNPWSPV